MKVGILTGNLYLVRWQVFCTNLAIVSFNIYIYMGHSMSNQHNFKINFRPPSQILMKICTKLVFIKTKKNLKFCANTTSRLNL